MAPVQRRAQAALSWRQVRQPARQHVDGAVQSSEQRRRGQQPHPRRCQLDCERDAVEPADDLGDGFGVCLGEAIVGPHG